MTWRAGSPRMAGVTALRRLSLNHRTLALWLALVVLGVKLLVPAGFMVGVVDGRVALQICSGFGPVAAAPMAHHAMADDAMAGDAMAGDAMAHHAMPDHAMPKHAASGDPATRHGGADHPAADMPCPFVALAHGVAMPVDPVLLAVALAFVLAPGFAAVVPIRLRSVPFLRPPLRGPPLPA